jgi:hypothetical protein
LSFSDVRSLLRFARTRCNFLVPYPPSLVPDPSSLVSDPSSLVSDPSSLVSDPSSLVSVANSCVPDPTLLVPSATSKLTQISNVPPTLFTIMPRFNQWRETVSAPYLVVSSQSSASPMLRPKPLPTLLRAAETWYGVLTRFFHRLAIVVLI